jgi:ADP-ribosylglycohydrolase
MALVLDREEYRRRVLGCWLGKNIGGTLGAPMEWRRQENEVTFYTQELGGEPLPNDDLDIQLLWLLVLERHGLAIDAHTLAEHWCLGVTPHWAEYGTAKVNMRAGLQPPLCGDFRNIYRHSCGSFIRTEIWACLAPGLPAVAAQYSYWDSILDHGGGEGTYAAVFTAALESAAFVLPDLRELVEVGLSYIPDECGVARAVLLAVSCAEEGTEWRQARERILAEHRGSSHMNLPQHTSQADREKGFHEGRQGYDAPSNIAIYVYGLLAGGDDFDEVICTTVNMGEDTDCTGATAGSVYGILHGAEKLPERWIEPIGHGIKTMSIDLGDYHGIPESVDDLTARTERLARQLLLRRGGGAVRFAEPGEGPSGAVEPAALKSDDGGAWLYAANGGPVFENGFFRVLLDYGGDPTIHPGQPRALRVTIENLRGPQALLTLRWYVPEGWEVSPARESVVQCLPRHIDEPPSPVFSFEAPLLREPLSRAVLEITSPGRPLTMLVPVTFLNGTLVGTP